jgi:two-component system sensor histidine kinase PilS (NtrC family)
MLDLRNRIKWQILFRAAFLMAMAVSALVLHFFYSEEMSGTLITLLLTGFGFSFLSLGVLRFAPERILKMVGWSQTAWEILYTSFLIYFTGGLASVFLILYALQILAAGAVLSSQGAIWSTVGCSLGFLIVALVQYGWEPLLQPQRISKILLVISTLSLVGGLVGYFFRSREKLAKSYARASAELKDLGQLHSAIVDHIPSGILYLDASSKISLVNHAAERMIGNSWVGKSLTGSPFEVLLMGRGRFESEITFEGGKKTFGHHLTKLPDGGSVIVFQDVTEFRSLERRMILNEKMASVGQLAAGIAHEIRNPLASLSGSIQLLQSELKLDPEFEKLMKIVIRETDRLDHLANSFLNYARPSELNLEEVTVNKVIGDVVTLLKNSEGVRTGAIKVTADMPIDFVCRCDARQLKQILWNLLTNAVQSIEQRGEVAVRVDHSDWEAAPCLRFTISDTGEGISDEVKKRIFDPFFTTKATGSGLGLALVYQMVKSHDGRLGVESKPGSGSKFWFEFFVNGPRPKSAEINSSATAA